MIERVVASVVGWHARRRRRQLEHRWRRAPFVQEQALLRLVERARETEFGLAHGFRRIRSVAEYQERVPLRQYSDFSPLWARALAGERDVTWPGRPRRPTPG
jgi:GH3 auxin-responsive promoter